MIRQSYETGRGSLPACAPRRPGTRRRLSRGVYPDRRHRDFPTRCRSPRLVERIATLLEEKKLPLLADVRDESSDLVRLVLEPKSRNVDAVVLMESLFRATELETRVPASISTCWTPQGVPRVMNLKEALQAFPRSSAREVLLRRTRFPGWRRSRAAARSLQRPDDRLSQTIDKVIKIIREERRSPRPS